MSEIIVILQAGPGEHVSHVRKEAERLCVPYFIHNGKIYESKTGEPVKDGWVSLHAYTRGPFDEA